jgi:two-component system response regulator MprA
VVDDDRFARRMLGDALEDRGFEVVTAEDGLAGLRTLVDEILDLDVLVTDVFMPAMDGEELIRRIRIAGGERDLGIVVVSSADLDPARLCAIGADAVIGKGAGLEAIAQAVDVTSRTRGRDPA